MRYVIIRDDDTSALTPIDCLERLYRPFLNRNLPVNLAVIPDVATDTTLPDGRPEGFLLAKNGTPERSVPIGNNVSLVRYLRENSGYHVVQHGLHHDYFEFDRQGAAEISRRLEEGTRLLTSAGFPRPQTFIAPYDKLSRAAVSEVARHFNILSTGWYELRRLPYSWWPDYLFQKKFAGAPHWRVNGTLLLSHPGCLLSCHRNYDSMLNEIIRSIDSRQLTVLVTHWWEYFRENKPDEEFIRQLHRTADYLASRADIKVVAFSDLLKNDLV
jgi:hypothetical protein